MEQMYVSFDDLILNFSQILTLLSNTTKSENFIGLENIKTYDPTSFSPRVKFVFEENTENEEAPYPNFLKVAAQIRVFHASLLRYIKPQEEESEKLDQLVTYGLLKEKKFVRVIGIKGFVTKTEHRKKRFEYLLFNVGVFPLEPSNEEEKQQFDLLISFLLEASRHSIFEENELILDVTKLSNCYHKSIISHVIKRTKFSQGDKLVLHKVKKGGGTTMVTTILLNRYLFEWRTPEGKSTEEKDLFYGKIEHSNQPVYVKIFYYTSMRNPIGNIFLNQNKVF